jgi:Zn-dependent oligopeptidase
MAFQNLASQNTPLIESLVEKRHEMASILGFSSYSEYTLQKKMAKNPSTVQKFEEDLT